jgi:predicted phage tail protein
VTSLQAGNYSISVTAVNAGGKSSSAGTSGGVQIDSQIAPGQVGQPATNVTNPTYPGSITWSWAAIGGGAVVTDNLRYELTGAGSGSVPGTSYSRSGLGVGSYSLQVRACNNAGCGGWSPASASGTITYVNQTTVIRTTCLISVADFLAYRTCSNVWVNPGLQFQAGCRGQQNGVQYIRIQSDPYTDYFVKGADTDRDPWSVDCGNGF